MATGDQRLPTPSLETGLVARIEHLRRAHKPTASLNKKLTQQVCERIKAECDLAELIDRTAHTIETSIDDLVVKHSEAPAYVTANYEQLHRAHTRLSFLVSAIQPKQVAAE